jgi:RimJ/RimL family protein N-acetyltransferase
MTAPTPARRIRKALHVQGRTLTFRDATTDDAAFILSLRTNVEKSRYLNPVSGELSEQQGWLGRYAHADDQAYFIIESKGEPIGTVRMYDPQGDSFCWGSWILKDGRPSHAAMESALMVYAYGLDHLGFAGAHFDVRKGNERVWQFHERFGAQRLGETESDYLYKVQKEAIFISRQRYRKFLDRTVSVKFKD